MFREHCAGDQRLENLRQGQIGNLHQLITNGGVSCDLHTIASQLFNESPHFRAIRTDLFCELRPADNQRGVVGEHADDMPQPVVVRQVNVGRSWYFSVASCARSRDALIIRLRKNETQMES